MTPNKKKKFIHILRMNFSDHLISMVLAPTQKLKTILIPRSCNKNELGLTKKLLK